MPRYSRSSSKSYVRTCFRYTKEPLQRLLATFIVLALIAGPGLLIYNDMPPQYSLSTTKINYSDPLVPQKFARPWDKDFQFSVMMDVHKHPNGIDPELVLQWLIAAGYNAVALTEHNTISDSLNVQKMAREKYNDKIKVIIGEEWTNCRMHMGLIGITEAIEPIKFPTDEQLQDVINRVHAMGGLVVVNHPPWSTWAGLDQPSNDDLVKWGVDFFDVTTYERLDLQTIYYAESKNISVVAGTDSHELGSAHAWTLLDVDPNNITEDSVMDALRSKKTSFIFDETGYQPPIISEAQPNGMYTFLYPWMTVGMFFHSYYNRVTGQYSFVEGYCGFGEEIVILKKEIAMSVGWLLFGWSVLEGVWGCMKWVYGKIIDKLNPNARRHRRLLDDDETPMDVWDKFPTL